MSTLDPRREKEAVNHEQADLDPCITGHPFQPMTTRAGAWSDICGHVDNDGWSCGYSRDEHADQEHSA
jgi:hypothetical protein